MAKVVDLTGKVFGRLEVLGMAGFTQNRKTAWLCRCECGTEKVITGSNMVHGNTVSCGCQRIEKATKHNHSHSRIYTTYRNMVRRCTDPLMPNYKNYGGRGITVCDRWKESFENFLTDMGEHPEGLSIDRVDNNKGYSPDNCKWATKKEQNNNQRGRAGSTRVNYEGKLYTMKELAEKTGLNSSMLSLRIIRYGWTIEKAVTLPSRTGNYKRSGSQHNANY